MCENGTNVGNNGSRTVWVDGVSVISLVILRQVQVGLSAQDDNGSSIDDSGPRYVA